MEVVLDTAENRIPVTDGYQETADAIAKLRGYLERNWDDITPLSDPSLQGQLSGLGSCESNHRKFMYRLKHQGKLWSQTGLNGMLRIITADQNGDYEDNLIKAGLLNQDVKITPTSNKRISTLGLFKHVPTGHVGVKQGRIPLNDSSSSAIGNLARMLG